MKIVILTWKELYKLENLIRQMKLEQSSPERSFEGFCKDELSGYIEYGQNTIKIGITED